METRLLSPSLLAYIGDSVYELKVRRWLLQKGNRSVNKVHHEAINLVNASAQARGLKAIKDSLTPEEQSIVRRGRNTNSGNTPSSASMNDYRLSTGLEALFGFHYLEGNNDRLTEIWDKMVEELKED